MIWEYTDGINFDFGVRKYQKVENRWSRQKQSLVSSVLTIKQKREKKDGKKEKIISLIYTEKARRSNEKPMVR